MRTDFRRTIFKPFVFDEERVRSIAKILQNRAGELSISIACADDATRSLKSVDKLLEYENTRSRRIISLSLSSYVERFTPEEMSIDIDIDCSTRPTTTNTSVRISGPEEWASTIMREIDEAVTGSRPWYSRISKIGEPSLWFLCLAIFFFTFFIGGLIYPSPTLTSVAIFAGLIIWPAWGVGHLIRYLFPSGVFLIGQEKARHKTKEKVRWLVIATVVGAALTGLRALAL